MSLNANLAEHMAGVYRNLRGFRVFPQSGVPDWSVVVNHEFTHLCLGVATLSGFVHQVLAVLAFTSSSPRKQLWKRLYEYAIAASIETHEGAATYCSLIFSMEAQDPKMVFDAYSVPTRYQQWYSLFANVISPSLPPKVRGELARAIALYAFDDPDQPILKANWGDLSNPSNSSVLISAVDGRLHRLLDLTATTSLQDEVAAATDAQPPERASDELLRQFLGRRREWSVQRQCTLRQLLLKHCSHVIPSNVYDNTVLAEASFLVLNHLRSLCRRYDEDSLAAFNPDFSNMPGEDPIFYDVEVLMPSRPLSGLYRIEGPEEISSPTLIDIARPPIDCVLSPNKILRAGEAYLRYFFLNRAYKCEPEVFYSITDEIPESIWTEQNTIVSMYAKSMELDAREVVKPDRLAHLNIWLSHLSRHKFDELLAMSPAWRYEILLWSDCPGIGTFILLNHHLNVSWCFHSCGAALEIFSEEASMHLLRRSEVDLVFEHLTKVLLCLLPYISPSEGSPLSIE